MPQVDAPTPNLTLAQLNEFVSEQETVLDGPLTAIGNKDGQTTITIDDQDPNGSPAIHSVITTSAPPAGAKIIGTGKIYVSGTLTDATAYSPVSGSITSEFARQEHRIGTKGSQRSRRSPPKSSRRGG